MIKVYVSSTKLDLENERRVVLDWLADNRYERRHSYVADSDTVRDSCLADVQACDVYVLILGHRRGFVPPQDNPRGLAITELEYEAALAKPMAVVALCPTYIVDVALTDIAHPDAYTQVLAFRERVSTAHRPAQFKDLTELLGALGPALARATPQQQVLPPAWQWPVAWDALAYAAAKRANFTGRAWLFAEIEAWLARPAPRDLLLRADFGVGKTAFVAEFVHRDAQRAPPDHRVVAVHYCQHDTRETLRAATFVRSLAAQLAQALPAYRAAVESSPLARQQLDRAADDPGSAFEAALANPLALLPAPGAAALVLVDALDESLEADAANRRQAGIVQLLAEKASRLPSWLRVLVTSRNNPAVTDRLRAAFSPKEIDGEARLNLDDIEAYALARGVAEPLAGMLAAQGATPQQLARELRTKSGGKFLFAVRVFDDLVAGRMDPGLILALPPGIEAFYLDAFDRRFERAGRDYAEAGRLLGVLAAMREPLPPDELAEVLGTSGHALKQLRSELFPDLVRVREGCWAFDHASLREWLSQDDEAGHARAGRYAVDLSLARRTLATWAKARVDADPRAAPLHALRHLCAYLHDSGRSDEVARLLTTWPWLRAKLTRCGVLALLADFESAPPDAGLEVLARTLALCTHVLIEAPGQLAAQLLGRVRPEAAPGLAVLLTACREEGGAPWLRPRMASLPPPGHLWRVLRGHDDLIQSIGYSTDGRWLLSGSADGRARLWQAAGDAGPVLDADCGPLNQALFSHDGQWIVTTHEAGGARLWTLGGTMLRLFETPASAIRAAFSPDDQLLVAGCRDRVARLWRLDGTPLATLEGHEGRLVDVAFSPDGSLIASSSTDRTARLWRVDGTPVAVLPHDQMVARVVFSPDGRTVATASSDATAKLWRLDGTLVATLRGHAQAINHLVYSPDGRLIATASNDNMARLWRADGSPVAELAGHGGWVNHVAFSPDGRLLVTGACDDKARVWTTEGERVAVLRGHNGWVVHTTFSPDGRTIATGANDGRVLLWRVWQHPAARLPALPAHERGVNSVLPHGKAGLVLSTGNDRQARLWTEAGCLQLAWPAHDERLTGGAWMPDGQGLLTASTDTTARLWAVDGRLIATLVGHMTTINVVRADPTGTLIATGANDGQVRLWSAQGTCLAVLDGHGDAVNDLAFSPNGRQLASASSDTTLRLWSREGRELALLEGHEAWVLRVAFAPDGGQLLSGAEDGSVRLWQADGRPLAVAAGHADAVTGVGWLGGAEPWVTASRDGSLRQWGTAGDSGGVLTGRGDALQALALADDGRTLASGGGDGVLQLWRDGLPLAALNIDVPIVALAFAGHRIVCGDGAGSVHVLDIVEPGASARAAQS